MTLRWWLIHMGQCYSLAAQRPAGVFYGTRQELAGMPLQAILEYALLLERNSVQLFMAFESLGITDT
ncbi:hypothetical protein LINGRAPRIM_LOCUS575 [Linum grandiflorum]